MLAPSSPVAFPLSSSPVKSKRPRATEVPKPPKPRVVGGFVADDDSDDDEPVALEERSPKRRMLDHGRTPEPITTPPDSQLIEEELEEEETERYERLFGGAGSQTAAPLLFSSSLLASDNNDNSDCSYRVSTCSGKSVPIRQRKTTATVSYEAMAAARSRTKEGRAKRSYYGIEIHELVDAAAKQIAEGREKEPAAAATPPPDTPPMANPERDNAVHSVEDQNTNADVKKPKRTLLWTEKYRARSFMDLVGDDLTNRQVLRWLKRWDPIVFPHAAKKPPAVRRKQQQQQQPEEERPHRQILMLTGPPGLGKTTLAHVCARQAGYEVMEINASDDRSKDVVKGRIRTSLGTESVKTVENKKTVGAGGKQPKVARPVCVVVDEVDGVVTGSGGSGEGGFVKALIDLILLDQKNGASGASGSSGAGRKKKKGDDFRQMRPLILICNDVYHPSLRPLRQSGLAEIIHVGKPSVEAVVTRLKSVFEKEGIPCEKDAARKLCEAAWGITSGIDARRGAESNVEGDLRGVMVVGEWVAGRLRATSPNGTPCLTRQWLDKHIVQDLAHGGGGARGLGRGGTKEIVTRIFQEGAGFPKQNLTATTSQPKNTRHEQPQAQLGFSEQQKKYAMGRLKEMIDASGEVDRIMTEIFSEYPNRDFNDDSFLTKPDTAYEWMHFHDTCSSRLFSNQDWELGPYISQSILACHHLFASPRRHQPQTRQWGDDEAGAAQAAPLPFTGPRADFAAHEAAKGNRAMLQGIHAQLPPTLMRAFRSPEHVATDFLPYLVRLVSPDVKPVLVGGGGDKGAVASVRREGEKAMVKRAAAVLAEVGIALHKGKIEAEGPAAGPVLQRTQWVYRMEPDLDMLATFETAGAHVLSMQAPTRYAVRQVLDQELQKTIAMRENAARQARFQVGKKPTDDQQEDYVFDGKENISGGKEQKADKAAMSAVKRDFFGRVIVERPRQFGQDTDGNRDAAGRKMADVAAAEGTKVWVTYHEGLNNAVRKPISLEEFLRGL
ncbi:chromosome transmission fidelity protein 18 [Diplogelasinospora grovesii]|uniref:Chromosome transmission fidelity protein 18 n=1 Tax=Diplogelasinospora grovesii TaxID=303347 RepID=A0AAN6N622_9PEZI|nr:chromosome transmission fidelity protein 18 [Diplogelasinospora grovesii]